ncbi:Protein PAL OF QUIRKY [Cardamine amara subsp. amara]|uniref:Protein PAL OF QUIRKY n=1 Tax=Cardamine amara subsp. amara TaxID=228776 RepID=A0ABD1BY21_CARAN
MVAVAENRKTKNGENSLKFLCSYGGRILPRSIDGKLRYVGGFTRVLSVHHPISFSELMVKLEEFCGYSVELKCQLPDGDLETLISVKSDEDLTNIVEEYDRVNGGKIRAILSTPKLMSPRSSGGDLSPKSPFSVVASPSPPLYCLPPAENLLSRFRMRAGEYSRCCNCRVHNRDSKLIWQ